ncbi:unnamed protein product [Adineta steineri]|uniref:Uncharacterized protein n=1 Tax=Adineta steineri TaxID=433720 RepID=A0A814DDN0_9BILA|nr:unnamed protein product [Adineta steineri]CAF3642409.1 unnamed protein product [Adineta steineri]
MKCIALLAVFCCIAACAGQGSLSLDFLSDNILNPLLDSIQTNALSMLQSQLSSLISSLFTGIGKRGIADALNINLPQVLAPFIAKIKGLYQQVFTVFLSIVQNPTEWIMKPDWARIEFVRIASEVEVIVSKLSLGSDFLQPLVALVQKHLGTLIDQFQGIIFQVLQSAQAIKPLIGNLIQG